jgi:hypothetical protein
MSDRVWTIEELDRVHPLDGWAWAFDDQVGWYARTMHGNATVCIDLQGEVLALWGGTEKISPHRNVALAVILVSKGQDSMKAMADKLADVAKDNRARADRAYTDTHAARVEGMADAYEDVAAMLIRGTVAG